MICKTTFNINKKAVAYSFSKAAKRYDQFAQLQRDIGMALLTRVKLKAPAKVLDLGCGTGYFSEKLCAIYPTCQMTCLDISDAMLHQVTKKQLPQVNCLQADIDNLPVACRYYDLIFSNLAMQWSDNLEGCVKQLKARLNEGGKLCFSTLIDGSLYELTRAWKTVDQHPHTNSFLAIEQVIELLQRSGFRELNIQTQTRILHYDNVVEVMRALKGIGANHVHDQQPLTVKGRTLLGLLEKGYAPFVNKQGQLPLTYQVCYVEAEK